MAMISNPKELSGEKSGAAVVKPASEARHIFWKRLAAAGFTGSGMTFSYALLKLAYYWPVLQASYNVQFTCFQ